MLRKLRSFDFFRKYTNEDKTGSCLGGFCSVISVILILFFLWFELVEYCNTEIERKVMLDSSENSNTVAINLELEFSKVPCNALQLLQKDIFDLKKVSLQVLRNLKLIRLDRKGRELRESTEDSSIIQQVGSREGCLINGSINVQKSQGFIQFFISIPDSQFNAEDTKYIDFSHKFRSLYLGDTQTKEMLEKNYCMREFDRAQDIPKQQDVNKCEYYLKSLPQFLTIPYGKLRSESYQYSIYYECSQKARTLGGYVLTITFGNSPIGIKYTYFPKSFWQLLISFCAIISGIYVITGILLKSF